MPRVRAVTGLSLMKWRALLRRSPTVASRDWLMRLCVESIQLGYATELFMTRSYLRNFAGKLEEYMRSTEECLPIIEEYFQKKREQQSSMMSWNRFTCVSGIVTIGLVFLKIRRVLAPEAPPPSKSAEQPKGETEGETDGTEWFSDMLDSD